MRQNDASDLRRSVEDPAVEFDALVMRLGHVHGLAHAERQARDAVVSSGLLRCNRRSGIASGGWVPHGTGGWTKRWRAQSGGRGGGERAGARGRAGGR